MDLITNPFAVLSVTTRDSRRVIISRAEERALRSDSEACKEARNILTTPRLRLGAEIGWLPGVSPRRALEILGAITSGESTRPPDVGGIPALAQCNANAAFMATFHPDPAQCVHIEELIATVASEFDALDLEFVLRIINEDREVSGFPQVRDHAALLEALRDQRRTLCSALLGALDRVPNPDDMLTSILTNTFASSNSSIPLLLEEVIADYHIRVQRHLDVLSNRIDALLKEMRDGLSRTKRKYTGLDARLLKLKDLVSQWDRLAQPMQIVEKTKGRDESISSDLASRVREFSVSIANEYGLFDEAQQLTLLLQTSFEELPQFSESLLEDEQILAKLAREQKAYVERISFEAQVGGSKFSIDPEQVTYGRESVRTREINGVSWGMTKHYTNGIYTGTEYQVNLSDAKSSLNISFRSSLLNSATNLEPIYKAIVSKVWDAVCIRLIEETLTKLNKGVTCHYGDSLDQVAVSRSGVMLSRKKFWSGSEPVLVPWENVRKASQDGTLVLWSHNDEKVRGVLQYSYHTNTHILSAVLDYLWKDGRVFNLRDGKL